MKSPLIFITIFYSITENKREDDLKLWQTPLLLLHHVQLLQLGLVFSLHATQHVPYDHHERVKLKHATWHIRTTEVSLDRTKQMILNVLTAKQKESNLKVYVCSWMCSRTWLRLRLLSILRETRWGRLLEARCSLGMPSFLWLKVHL